MCAGAGGCRGISMSPDDGGANLRWGSNGATAGWGILAILVDIIMWTLWAVELLSFSPVTTV